VGVMAIHVLHNFRSPKSDGPDSTNVRPSNWNDEHDMHADEVGFVLGRNNGGTGTGPLQELPLSFSPDGDASFTSAMGGIKGAVGTTAERQAAPARGTFRWNSDTMQFELFGMNGSSTWDPPVTLVPTAPVTATVDTNGRWVVGLDPTFIAGIPPPTYLSHYTFTPANTPLGAFSFPTPAITEGTQLLHVSYTPHKIGNRIRIEVDCVAAGQNLWGALAIWVNGGAVAAVNWVYFNNVASQSTPLRLVHSFVPPDLAALAIDIRGGGGALINSEGAITNMSILETVSGN